MPEHVPVLEDIRILIQSELGYASPDDIVPEATLHTLGIDSLAAVNLVVALSADAGVDLEDFIDDLDTPTDIAGLCEIAVRFRTIPA